jgi:hypothetical protein
MDKVEFVSNVCAHLPVAHHMARTMLANDFLPLPRLPGVPRVDLEFFERITSVSSPDDLATYTLLRALKAFPALGTLRYRSS